MIMILLVIVALCQLINAEPITSIAKEEWELFKLEHQKSYDGIVEERFRMKIFMENKLAVIEHNKLYAQNLTTFQMKINHLSDMLPSEIVATMTGFRGEGDKNHVPSLYIPPDEDVKLPSSVDWRLKGVVTPVKSQGYCGSGWAFAATGSLEGQHARKTGHLVSLSEQNLIDCCSWCQGCRGGRMTSAYDCIYYERGIESESYYPYTASEGLCKYNALFAAANVTGYMVVRQDSEWDLMNAVATIGPISVAINAGNPSFAHYSHGIYYEPNCPVYGINHGILVVGYGREWGVDYWLLKNSWTTLWGNQGYMKMARNRGNMCGIAHEASFPLV